MRRANPIQAEAEQRYWRRRANRQVRKKRRARSLLRWVVVGSLNLALLAMVAYSATKALERLRSSREFAVRQIEMTGVHRASADALREALHPFMGHNVLDLDLNRIEAEVQRDPWIYGATVRRVLPETLQIKVRERVPAAVAIIGDRAHLVDRTGYVIGPVGPGRDDSLPVLTGLNGAHEDRLREALRKGAHLLARLERASPQFLHLLSELDLSRGDRVAARLLDGGPEILLDPQRIERNVVEFLELREEILRVAGPLRHVDLRWSDRISVLPAEELLTKN